MMRNGSHSVQAAQLAEASLVHLPIYVFKYDYSGQTYTALVEGSSGKVLANLFPAKAETPYLAVATLATVGFLLLSCLPLAGYQIYRETGLLVGVAAYLVAGAAFVLYRFAFGAEGARRALPLDPRTMIGLGLLVAIASGSLALLAGRPLMTGLWGRVAVPGLGALDVGTPVLFDVGVYLAVVGVTLSIILPLAEEE